MPSPHPFSESSFDADGSFFAGHAAKIRVAKILNKQGAKSMSRVKSFGRLAAIFGGMFLLIFSVPRNSQAQDKDDLTVTTSPSDKAAASQVKNLFRSATPARTPGAKAARSEGLLSLRASSHKDDSDSSFDKDDVRYPGDLTYLGGAVVDSAQSHNIYLLPNGKCPISQCWGDPAGFLKSVAHSDLIHLVDQYIGLSSNDRYTLGFNATLSYTPPATPLTDNDMLAVVHAVAALTGDSGYGHIFHIFLAPGQDECFDSTFSVCYSPDNPGSFFFCAYHSSVDFTDSVGHALYSVEPFQNVPGCQVRPGTPNGQLIDSTNDTLSHELIETITDPDGTAWINFSDNVLIGEEIADECAFDFFTATNAYGDPFVYRIGNKLFATQPEYSNALHGCAVH
jgi:hypothetical protein